MPMYIQFPTQALRGGIVFTGNTLGLSKADNTLSAGTSSSIGAFISLNTSQQAGNFPVGTTYDYLQNGSSAVLDLPLNCSVVYAELIWGATKIAGDQDVSARTNDPIVFQTPAGTFEVTPIATTAVENTNGLPSYGRSAIVTSLVQEGGAGVYSVGRVPGVLFSTSNRYLNAGWTLAVIFGSSSLPLRYITLQVGSIQSEEPPLTLTDFVTPTAGPIRARFLETMSAGNALISDVQFFNGGRLRGPNNDQNNVASSQINNSLGQLDTRGTFGNRNQSSLGFNNTVAGRQGWDITEFDVSSFLTNGQTSVVFDPSPTASDPERYVVRAVGFQVDLPVPELRFVKYTNRQAAAVGDIVEYAFLITNNGLIPIVNVILMDPLDPGTVFISGSLRINETIVEGDISEGVLLGTINAGQTLNVSFQVQVIEPLSQTLLLNEGNISYQFQPSASVPPVLDALDSNTIEIQFVNPKLLLLKCGQEFIRNGEKVLYTLFIINQGNTTLDNIVIFDPLPDNVQFIPGEVFLDNVQLPTADPRTGISIGSLAPGGVLQLTYQVMVTIDALNNIIKNQASSNFTYLVEHGEEPRQGSADSNVALTHVFQQVNLIIEIIKQPDIIIVNEPVQIVINVVNTSPILLLRILFITLFSSDSIELVPGSFMINGQTVREFLNSVIIRSLESLQSVQLSFFIVARYQPSPPTVRAMFRTASSDVDEQVSFEFQVEEQEE